MRRTLDERDLWLVDSLVVPASIHDADGYCVHINRPAELASGISNARMVGQHYSQLLPADAREAVHAQFQRAIGHGEPTDFETVFIDAGGHRRSTRAQHIPLSDGDGKVVGVLILAFEGRLSPSELVALQPLPELTPRQQEILELIAAGRSTAEIAKEFTLSRETVRNHLRNLFKALNAHTRPEAIAVAQRLGLLATPGLGPQVDDE